MKRICLLLFLSAALLLTGCNNSNQPASTAPAAQPAAAGNTIVVDKTTAGSVTGTISFNGKEPKFPLLDMTADPGCPSTPLMPEVVVAKNGKLANVFVYIKEGLPQGTFAAPNDPVVLTQKGCRYVPHVTGVMVGQPFKILNEDRADHNIHSMSTGNPPFNESQMPTDKPIIKTFAQQEVMVPLECNQHPWMRAYLSILPHPYFATSAADGTFTIQNLPPGDYTLTAVHEKYGEQTVKIKVESKQTAKADFTFAPGK
ncbi:MAG TPA: carboxypeptidase regulatory-like domain-containing protein [Candidatus Angelobacter sp.]|nr:carboxypeptidase regulatory-like domain-containing protein [Candidatus Angelobacter sp.]